MSEQKKARDMTPEELKQWLSSMTVTEEISGTIYIVTGSYEGEDSFIRKLERITSRKFTNQLGGHQ